MDKIITGYCLEPIFLQHETGKDHPEKPERLKVIQSLIDSTHDIFNLKWIRASESSKDQLCFFHTPSYVKQIEATSGKKKVIIDNDTITSADTYMAARYAVGGIFQLIDGIEAKIINNGFAFVRPPGHHAESDKGMGFCIFNNVVLAALYYINRYNAERVVILDWDVHHGNGTQTAFYSRKDVLYISIHQFPHFPGTGRIEDIGIGEGKGFTVNIPLPAGCKDQEYKIVFDQIILPIIYKYVPEIILVSAGFDAHKADPLGGINLTSKGYQYMARKIVEASDKLCEGKLIMVLEGGYHLKSLAESVGVVLEEMQHIGTDPLDNLAEDSSTHKSYQEIYLKEQFEKNFEKVIATQHKIWNI